MCGIVGWIDSECDLREKREVLYKMRESLYSRGPDEQGEFITAQAALLHRRLTIIDAENGKQPMKRTAAYGEYILVYNGELYNTAELREELKALGCTFKGHGDTEVVLNAYIVWKEKCAEKFNGIYAFAVYNTADKSLFLCRDKIGVKPLFYHIGANRLIFASEIKAVLASGVVSPTVNEDGLYEIFFLAPSRTCGRTAFSQIAELCPGEYAVYKDGSFTKTRYYSLKAHEHTENESQTIEHVRFLIEDSIKRQLVSNVPVCCFLSGGLDSSIITKVASQYFKENGLGQLSTYSVEYTDNKKFFQRSLFQPNADFEFISMMSKSADTKHTEVILENSQVADALIKSTAARDLPAMADIDSSLLLFCGEVRKDFKVALSGECADELFGGYPWYHNRDILFEQCFPWSRTQEVRRNVLKKGILPKGEEYVRQRYLDTVNSTDKLSGESDLDGRMREMFVLNFNWFMQCLLDRKDRCSMYNSLEVRVPFCDYRIADYAYNMPWHLKALGGREKGIVRKAFEDILPNEICRRKKSPYPKTHNPVYFKAVSDRVRQILDSDSIVNSFLDREAVLNLIENPDSISSPWYGQLMKTPQILAFFIQLDFWFREYGVILE